MSKQTSKVIGYVVLDKFGKPLYWERTERKFYRSEAGKTPATMFEQRDKVRSAIRTEDTRTLNDSPKASSLAPFAILAIEIKL